MGKCVFKSYLKCSRLQDWSWRVTLQWPMREITLTQQQSHAWLAFSKTHRVHFAPNSTINTLRLRQNGRHFADDVFKCIFLNENVWISIKFSLKFVPKGPIYNNPALVQIMAWRLSGDKPLSEPMMVSLLTHICVTRPQWVNTDYVYFVGVP